MGLDACLSNIVLCANQAGITVSEIAAQDALGGTALAVTVPVVVTKVRRSAAALADGAAELVVNRTIISADMEQKILFGQRAPDSSGNPTNRLIGAHSGEISDTHPGFAVEVLSKNPDGTRNTKLVTQFEDGNVSRIKTSTLFPEHWSNADVINAVKQTGSNIPIAIRNDGAALYQSTVNGVKIEVIKVGDSVTAAYPCGRGCMSVSTFKGL
jgi:filamentous hemagglutinin